MDRNEIRTRISSYIFDVKCLVPFECEVYVTYNTRTEGDHVGKIVQSPTDADLIFTDMDDVEKFHITINQDHFPTRLHIHGETRVINFMSTLASYFIHEANKQSLIAVAAINDIDKAVENGNVYVADPDTAYITYRGQKPENEEVSAYEEQLGVFKAKKPKEMKLCGCEETCFERGERWGHLEGVICKHLSEKEDGAGNGLITFCEKFDTPVEAYDTKEHHDRLISDRQKTKDVLTQLADKITQNTSCNNILNFMECFKDIVISGEIFSRNFKRSCVIFRHAVNLSLKLDENLRTVHGINSLRTAMDVEIDGCANLGRATIAKSYGSDHSLCEKCRSKNSECPCAEKVYAEKFGYIVRECKYYNTLTGTDIAEAIVAHMKSPADGNLVIKDGTTGIEYMISTIGKDENDKIKIIITAMPFGKQV